MLCTFARVVPNDDGKPNDHLIPFGLRDIYDTYDAPCHVPRCVSLRARLADFVRWQSTRRRIQQPRRGYVRPTRWSCLGLAWLARSLVRSYFGPVLFDVLHNRSYVLYSSHACTQCIVGVYLLFEMIDVCTLVVCCPAPISIS